MSEENVKLPKINKMAPNAVDLKTINYLPENVVKAMEILINDPTFIKSLENSIKNILKDDKIDINDIPELIFLITNAYNTVENIKLNYDDLPTLIKLLFNHIVQKLNLISDNNLIECNKMVDSALKLVMFKPMLSKSITNCLNKLLCCYK